MCLSVSNPRTPLCVLGSAVPTQTDRPALLVVHANPAQVHTAIGYGDVLALIFEV